MEREFGSGLVWRLLTCILSLVGKYLLRNCNGGTEKGQSLVSCPALPLFCGPAQRGDLDSRAFTLGPCPALPLSPPPSILPPAFLKGGELLGFGILVEAEGDGI